MSPDIQRKLIIQGATVREDRPSEAGYYSPAVPRIHVARWPFVLSFFVVVLMAVVSLKQF